MYVLSFARAYIYLLFPLWSRLPFFFSSFLHALLFLFFPFLLPCCATVLYVNKNNNNKKKMQSSLLSPFLRSIGFLYLLRCLKKNNSNCKKKKMWWRDFLLLRKAVCLLRWSFSSFMKCRFRFFFLILLLPLRRSETLYCRREFASRALFVFLAEMCP